LNSQTKKPWTDQQIDESVAKILQYGVASAATVVSIGMALYLVKPDNKLLELHQIMGNPISLRNYLDLSTYLQMNQEQGIILLGLAILVATPIVRVVFSVYAFAKQRDYVYVTITLVVVAILFYSFVGLKN
jgi:uncharacterized membrane protein